MKYKVKARRGVVNWESNLPESFLLPLRFYELPIEDVKMDFEQSERVFVLEDLDENIKPPHNFGNMVYFSETQAKELLKLLQTKLKGDSE